MKLRNRVTDTTFLRGVALEEKSCCLCGRGESRALAERDGAGVPIRTVICQRCGLIYLNPRPSDTWYRDFYRSKGGMHHAYKHGSEHDGQKPSGGGFEDARRHGRALAQNLGAFMRPAGVTIDVGSSEGGVLAGLGDVLPIQPVGIEPVPEEAAHATRRGIPTHTALIEDMGTLGIALPAAANIVCVKALNHLLNPAHFCAWAWRALAENGRLILEVKNFRHQCRRSGRISAGIQLDHPYMFVPETLSALVTEAGFDILSLDVDEGKPKRRLEAQRRAGLPIGHIRLVAEKTSREPFSRAVNAAPQRVARIRRALQPLNLYIHYVVHHANVQENIQARFRRYAV